MYNSSKLVDGYSLDATDGYSYTSDWVDVRKYDSFSMSVVFTGGTPVGTLQLQQSNDRQFTGGNKIVPLIAASAENSSGTTKSVSDITNLPGGWGAVTAAVNGAATVYVLDQRFCPFGWARLVYTASSNVVTQLDVFLTVKNHQ